MGQVDFNLKGDDAATQDCTVDAKLHRLYGIRDGLRRRCRALRTANGQIDTERAERGMDAIAAWAECTELVIVLTYDIDRAEGQIARLPDAFALNAHLQAQAARQRHELTEARLRLDELRRNMAEVIVQEGT